MYWYDAINTINPFKQLKCNLELKFSDFKIFKKLQEFLSHSLTTTINLQPKLLGLWPPFFPSTKFISVRMNLYCLLLSSVSQPFHVYSA